MPECQQTQGSAHCVPGSVEGAPNKQISLGCSHCAHSQSRALPGPNLTWQVLGQVTNSQFPHLYKGMLTASHHWATVGI